MFNSTKIIPKYTSKLLIGKYTLINNAKTTNGSIATKLTLIDLNNESRETPHIRLAIRGKIIMFTIIWGTAVPIATPTIPIFWTSATLKMIFITASTTLHLAMILCLPRPKITPEIVY